jgi:signal transduction histidine kinase
VKRDLPGDRWTRSESRNRHFKRYATSDPALERPAGSIGLGLYIVREIVVANGGPVTITSSEKEGTTFTVCILRLLPFEGDNADAARSVDPEPAV